MEEYRMKKIYFTLIAVLCFVISFAQSPDSASVAEQAQPQELIARRAGNLTKASADSAYMENKYLDAIDIYEAVLKEKGESAEIRYNLGNSYYKADNIAKAILNYEKALLLAPGDEDIRANLEIARAKTVDKEEVAVEFFLTSWFSSIRNVATSDQWAGTGIAAFILMLAAIALYCFSKKVSLRKAGFFSAIVLLVVTVSANIFAYQQKSRLTAHDQAIITAPSVTVRSTPSESGTELFVIHEGHKVTIKDGSMSEWKEISIGNNQVGWVLSSTLEII